MERVAATEPDTERTKQRDMWTPAEFQRHLRAALVHLYDPDFLRRSPLAQALGLERRADLPLALQNALIEAIESLKPGPDDPPGSRSRRISDLLLYRYVQQLSQEEVADQLGLSVRHLRRTQGEALEALCRSLCERYHLSSEIGSALSPADADGILPLGMPGLDDELAWLRDAPLDEPAQLDQALREAARLARPLADQHGVTLVVEEAQAMPLLAAQPIALRQIVLNLLSVAIARTPRGLVRVWARSLHSEVEVRWACQQARPGPRLPLDQEGDALQVAKRLAMFCRGRLHCSTEHGAFCASLVLPSLEQDSILVIDDNAETLEFMQRYTLGTRYRLVTTRDPEEAQRLAIETEPAAILLDVMMPRIDGWTILGQLQQHPQTRHIPIIVCTVMPQEALALSLGASAFLRKPVTRQAFLSALDRLVAARETGSR